MSPTVYVVSGANRGLGLGLVSELASRTNTVVFAGARDPTNAAALNGLAKKSPETFFVVKLASGSVEDAENVAKEAESKFGKVDVIIANAGVATNMKTVLDASLSDFTEYFAVNTLGPIVLYKSFAHLLNKSESGVPKFVLISTAGASMAAPMPFGMAAYGASKAAANYVMVQLHAQNEKLVSLAISPGFVASDMGKQGAKDFGVPESVMISVEESATAVLKRVDESKRSEAAQFVNYTGEAIPW